MDSRFNKKFQLEVSLTEKDMADGILVVQRIKHEGTKVVENHSIVLREWIIDRIKTCCDNGDKEKVYSFACQLAGFDKRAQLERAIVGRVDEFIEQQKEEANQNGRTEIDE